MEDKGAVWVMLDMVLPLLGESILKDLRQFDNPPFLGFRRASIQQDGTRL